MTRICFLMISFDLFVAGIADETPQQVVTRYNNYKAICNGMGYENVHCKVDTIAFQSSLTKTLENMKNQETVIFDKVSLNEGNAYDNTSGIFTAPSDGVYSFTWTILTASERYFVSEIVHNGHRVAYNYADGRGLNAYLMSTSHANIKMKKVEKVWIRARDISGKYAYGENYCYFSGKKL